MKRVFRTLLLSVLIVMTLGTVAHATKNIEKYNYKAVGTKQNTWIKPKGCESKGTYNSDYTVYTSTYTCYRYKVTVPANYYMTLTIKGEQYTDLYLSKALKGSSENPLDYWYNSQSTGAKTFYVALPKGTYYLFSDYNYGKFAFKYKLCKYVTKPNYISSKALNWKANKKLPIVQLPGNNFARWYKIKLTKKKRIYVYGANDIDLFDAKRQPLEVRSSDDSDNDIYYSYNKLNAGIYYIRVLGIRPRHYSSHTWHGAVEIVWWK